jgi:hypothetical protein
MALDYLFLVEDLDINGEHNPVLLCSNEALAYDLAEKIGGAVVRLPLIDAEAE